MIYYFRNNHIITAAFTWTWVVHSIKTFWIDIKWRMLMLLLDLVLYAPKLSILYFIFIFWFLRMQWCFYKLMHSCTKLILKNKFIVKNNLDWRKLLYNFWVHLEGQGIWRAAVFSSIILVWNLVWVFQTLPTKKWQIGIITTCHLITFSLFNSLVSFSFPTKNSNH